VGVLPRVILFGWTAVREVDCAFGSNPPNELRFSAGARPYPLLRNVLSIISLKTKAAASRQRR